MDAVELIAEVCVTQDPDIDLEDIKIRVIEGVGGWVQADKIMIRIEEHDPADPSLDCFVMLAECLAHELRHVGQKARHKRLTGDAWLEHLYDMVDYEYTEQPDEVDACDFSALIVRELFGIDTARAMAARYREDVRARLVAFQWPTI
jgi:hypothetical protein